MTRRAVPAHAALAIGAGLTLAGAGCTDASEPPLLLDFQTRSACNTQPSACSGTGPETLDVQGVRVVFERLPQHPMVGLVLSFSQDSLPAPRQLWAESLALDLFQLGGARRWQTPEWAAKLDELGASVGTSASTDLSVIAASVPVPYWRELWDLLVEGTADPRSSDWEINAWKGWQASLGRVALDDPGAAAGDYAWTRLFVGQRYNLRDENRDLIDRLDDVDVLWAWQGLRSKRRLLVTLVGDVEPEAVTDAVRDAFGELPEQAASGFPPPAPEPPPAETPDAVILPYPDSPTWHIRSYFRGPSLDSPDYAALDLGLAALDRRLFQVVRDEQGLAYTASAGLVGERESVGVLGLASVAPRDALALARTEIAQLETAGPTEDELAMARSRLRMDLLRQLTTPYGIASTLTRWQQLAGRREALDDYLHGLDTIEPSTVAAVLATYLRDATVAAAGAGGPLELEDLETLYVTP